MSLMSSGSMIGGERGSAQGDREMGMEGGVGERVTRVPRRGGWGVGEGLLEWDCEQVVKWLNTVLSASDNPSVLRGRDEIFAAFRRCFVHTHTH